MNFPNVSGNEQLKQEQLKAIDLQTNYTNDYSQQEIAEKVDVTTRTIRNWNNDPTYKRVKDQLSLLRLPVSDIDQAMTREAKAGNTAAARLLYKRAGLIDGDKPVINVEQNQAQTSDQQSQKKTIDLSEQLADDPEAREYVRKLRQKQQQAESD